jgi:hypothetical protein
MRRSCVPCPATSWFGAVRRRPWTAGVCLPTHSDCSVSLSDLGLGKATCWLGCNRAARLCSANTPGSSPHQHLSEAAKTHAILGGARAAVLRRLLFALMRTAVTHPIRFFTGLRSTWLLGRRSDRGLARHFAYLAEACVLLGMARKQHIDHVHAHFGTNPTAVAMLCRRMGGPPYSFTVHGPDEFDKATILGFASKARQPL